MNKQILLLSDVPKQNIGQKFRVEDTLWVLKNAGYTTHYLNTTDSKVLEIASQSDLIIIYRTPWNPILAKVKEICTKKGVNLVYNVDDILFDPTLMQPKWFDFLTDKPKEELDKWMKLAQGNQLTLKACNAAILSTQTLADEAAKYIRQTFVIPNCIHPNLLNFANEASSSRKPFYDDQRICIGYISGTTTNNRNFNIALPSLLHILEENPSVRLTIVGDINISTSIKHKYISRLTVKPKVPLEELFSIMNGFDINIFPLEIGNPFCETKSELRLLFASLLSIPTIASAVQTLKESIQHGKTGFLAETTRDWVDNLTLLINDKNIRQSVGVQSRNFTIEQFGPNRLVENTMQVINQIME